jgi:hypothetical protein
MIDHISVGSTIFVLSQGNLRSTPLIRSACPDLDTQRIQNFNQHERGGSALLSKKKKITALLTLTQKAKDLVKIPYLVLEQSTLGLSPPNPGRRKQLLGAYLAKAWTFPLNRTVISAQVGRIFARNQSMRN